MNSFTRMLFKASSGLVDWKVGTALFNIEALQNHGNRSVIIDRSPNAPYPHYCNRSWETNFWEGHFTVIAVLVSVVILGTYHVCPSSTTTVSFSVCKTKRKYKALIILQGWSNHGHRYDVLVWISAVYFITSTWQHSWTVILNLTVWCNKHFVTVTITWYQLIDAHKTVVRENNYPS